jgi:hypothetical protein
VQYEAMKAGALIASCSPDDPDCGWTVQIVVEDRETALGIVSAWKDRVDRCDLRPMGT